MRFKIDYILILFFIFGIGNAFSQSYNQLVNFADQKMIEGDYFYAIDYYDKAMKIDSNSVEILWKFAEAQRMYKNYEKAEYYYQKVYNKEQGKIYPLSIFWLATMQHYNGKYTESLDNWKRAKKEYAKQRKEYTYLKSVQEVKSTLWAKKAVEDTLKLSIKSLDSPVNSNDTELAPIRFGNKLYFTSLKADSINFNEELFTEDYSLQIYSAEKNDSSFKNVKRLDGIYLSGFHSANGTFSQDGKRFYFSRCDKNFQCKIYVGRVEGDKIVDVDILGDVINEEGANTTMPNIAFIDGKEYLFFSSNREKTNGGLDIWFSEIKNGNQYMKPRNLGKQINSLDDDITPFYDAKSDRLYFSSSWHPGFGGQDIFYCERIEGTLSFSSPINIGLPINSSQNDTYFIVDDEGNYFFSSNRVGVNYTKNPTCCNDIFSVIFPKAEEIVPPTRFESLEELNSKLPVVLYFHNDEPNPRTRDTTTNLTYIQSYDSYIELKSTYQKEYSKGLSGDEAEDAKEDIEDFFIEYVEQGVIDLEEFLRLLIIELNRGYDIEVTIKGFASPLAQTDYNVNLTKRRINSLINYLYKYGKGEFIPYLNGTAENGGSLKFIQIPFGEYTADKLISDNVNDTKNSVYSRKAALERKIEIQSVSFVNQDSTYAEMKFDTEIYDFGKSKQGDILTYEFKFTNTGKEILIIDDIIVECNCTDVEISSKTIKPGETGTIKVKVNTENLMGLTVKKITINSNVKNNFKEISITTEVFK